MSLFKKKTIKYKQKSHLLDEHNTGVFQFSVHIEKSNQNSVFVHDNEIYINILPEVFDLLYNIKYYNTFSDSNKKIIYNKFLTDFRVHHEPLGRLRILYQHKDIFNYDDKYKMFNKWLYDVVPTHNISNILYQKRFYRISDIHAIISLRIVYLEEYLIESKHPDFIKRSSKEIDVNITNNIPNLMEHLHDKNSIYTTDITIVDSLIKEILVLCAKYKKVSSISNEVYRIKSTPGYIKDLIKLFKELPQDDQKDSVNKLIKTLTNILIQIKEIIKNLEENNIFEFDVQCKFLENIYKE